MTESLVNEWLTDCADFTSTELHTFATTLAQDNEIVRALYVLLEERSKYSELVDTVCNQLFNFYRSREIELQRFTLQFVPTLIFIYLNSVAHGDIKGNCGKPVPIQAAIFSLNFRQQGFPFGSRCANWCAAERSPIQVLTELFDMEDRRSRAPTARPLPSNCRSVETLLIGLYNLEIVDKTGEPKAVSFRLPSLAMLSIYHEPSSLTPASLTESAVRRFEECNTKLVSWGPLQQVETLNAQNRLKVMTAILFIYNQQLSYINKSALEQFAKVATKLVTQGFTKPGHHQRSSYGSESSFVPRLLPRIPVSNQFLLEFLHGIYFAMYNDCWYVGSQAVEDIHNRACYDGYPDVMLVTNAIRNSSSSGPSGQPGEGSMGISVALSPATATATVSKSMITNASFRTKKLPDDIPIQVAKDEAGGEGKPNLVSITEEQEGGQDPTRGGSIRQSREIKDRAKMSNFVLGKKPRDKDGKASKNGYVSVEKEGKKSNSQAAGKESVKGGRSMLSNDQTDTGNEMTMNGTGMKKKITDNNMINNTATSDTSAMNLGDVEQQTRHGILATADGMIDSVELETPVSLRSHESDSLGSSVQVSSV